MAVNHGQLNSENDPLPIDKLVLGGKMKTENLEPWKLASSWM